MVGKIIEIRGMFPKASAEDKLALVEKFKATFVKIIAYLKT